MRNRAKCKLCGDVIESYHSTDHVQCNCGEIDVFGGESLRCAAKNWNNFLRIDDQGNEIIPKVENGLDDPVSAEIYHKGKVGKSELHSEICEMIKRYESLPRHVMDAPVTHSDLLSVLLLLSELFRD